MTEPSCVILPSGRAVVVRRPYPNGVGYLAAFGETKGNMPSTRDLYYLATSTYLRDALPCWDKKILATPEQDRRFKKGADIKDARTGWTVPSEYVEKATGGEPYRRGVGLHIEPLNFEDKNGKLLLLDSPAGAIDVNKKFDSENRVVIIPNSIVVVERLQKSGERGKVDETALILKVKDAYELEWKDQGRVFYPRVESVRPLFRGDDRYYDDRRFVYGDRLDDRLGVLEFVEQLTLEQLKELGNKAKTAVENLAAGIRSMLPASVQALIHAVVKQ